VVVLLSGHDEVVTDLAQVLETISEELIPDTFHNTERYRNNRLESTMVDSRPDSDRCAGSRPIGAMIVGNAFIRNLRRGLYELGVEARTCWLRVAASFDELAAVI